MADRPIAEMTLLFADSPHARSVTGALAVLLCLSCQAAAQEPVANPFERQYLSAPPAVQTPFEIGAWQPNEANPPVAAEWEPSSAIQLLSSETAVAPAPLEPLDYGFPCNTCMDGCQSCAQDCAPCTAKTRLGRFMHGVYISICCPDPCYEPKWYALSDAAFFTEAARPVTQQRMRWDAGLKMLFPDRAEYFWARADGSGKGPKPNAVAVDGLDYHVLSTYHEAGNGKFSFFTELPYRSLEVAGGPGGAGFQDMNMGTKTAIMDTELFQVTFQMRTFIPMGQTRKGLGTGHVSLEPSVLVGMNISPRWYFQGQVSEWIPLGGDPTYSGAVLHLHGSLNHLLFQFNKDVDLIATLEANSWSFQDGAYTDPVRGTLPAGDETYVSIGNGLRLVICDKIDFGVAGAIAVTDEHFAQELFRSELRWRF